MQIILAIKSKTAQKLGELLNLPVVRDLQRLEYEPETIIRWGNRQYFDGNQINRQKRLKEQVIKYCVENYYKKQDFLYQNQLKQNSQLLEDHLSIMGGINFMFVIIF